MNDSDAPDGFAPKLGSRPFGNRSQWTWRRMSSVLSWDGILPVVSPICTLATVGAPRIVQSMTVTFVPMVVALVRVRIARRQLVRACGDTRDVNRQAALGIAIVFLLGVEVFASILVLGKGQNAPWKEVVISYVAYLACILYALRPSQKMLWKVWELPLDALAQVILICTDSFGPPEKWLLAKFRDGTEATFESATEQAAFLSLLGSRRRDLVRDIVEAIGAKDQLANFERVWTVEQEQTVDGSSVSD